MKFLTQSGDNDSESYADDDKSDVNNNKEANTGGQYSSPVHIYSLESLLMGMYPFYLVCNQSSSGTVKRNVNILVDHPHTK